MYCFFFFFFNDTATTEIYTTHNTLSLHDALPISAWSPMASSVTDVHMDDVDDRSEEHTSELQSLCVISYAVFCLKKKKDKAERDSQRASQDRVPDQPAAICR